MREFEGKNPYMDYRDTVPFMNLSGFIRKQPILTDEVPVKSLKEELMKKRLSSMINIRRLEYRCRVEHYKNNLIK